MKRNLTLITTLLTFALMLFPNIAWGIDFKWENPEGDKSIFYLGQIFGTVGTALPGTGPALLGNLFSIFNIAVLALGSIVVSYTIILSTINTAQEGDVMGKKWSSMWIPLRSAVGMAFLIPTASGYSLLQILMMQIVVYGIAAANQVWFQVVNTMGTEGGTGVLGKATIDDVPLTAAAQSLFNTMVCQQVLNTDATCQTILGGKQVSAYATGSQVVVGVSGDTHYSNVCGGLAAGGVPDKVDPNSWRGANLAAFQYAASTLTAPASQVVSGETPSASSVIYTAKNALQGNITQVQQITTAPTGAMAEAKNNGWIFAGSYYFVMIKKNNNNVKYPAPVPVAGNTGPLGGSCSSAIAGAQADISAYLATTDPRGSAGSSTTLTLPKVSTNKKISSLLDAIASPMNKLFTDFMKSMTTSDPAGPVASLAALGADILNTAQDVWLGMILAALVLLLVVCTMSGISPMCWGVGGAISFLIPILTMIIALLWAVGALLGIYLPLVPYLVFTFTALGWLLLVIETIVAAPIVALGLVSPAGEHLGKASPAVLLVVNVFLRPSLMVVGLIGAVYLVNAAVSMLNFGFFATVQSAVSGLGIFGLIALLCLYGGTVISIIHECFSLIYILPDKIVRWLGGQQEQSQVKQQLESAKKSSEKGAEMGLGMMKAGASYAGEKLDAKASAGRKQYFGGKQEVAKAAAKGKGGDGDGAAGGGIDA